MTEPKTFTLDVPGAVLHYDVRANDDSDYPVLLMIGSPMGAEGFTTQAGHFADRTVVTYDPRSSQRSQRTDGALETSPDEHADDQQRRRGQRAGPGGQAPWAGPRAGGPRAARLPGTAGPRGGAGHHHGHPRAV